MRDDRAVTSQVSPVSGAGRSAGRIGHRLRPNRRLRLGVGRIRSSWWSIGQSALGGALAWEGADRLLHHQGPIFAAIAAIVCLSISHLNRLRRVVELAIGVTIGVGLADLVVHQLGRGGWQLGLVVLLAMTVALLLDGGNLIVNQAALQAVFVTVLPPPPGGYVARWQDALFGGGVALVVAFALPADVRSSVRQACDHVVGTVADALRASADAARSGDADRAADALDRLRTTQPMLDRWRDAVRSGEEISRLSPLRARAGSEVVAHRRALGPTDRAVRNLRVALRRVVAAVEDQQAYADSGAESVLDAGQHELPPALLDVLTDLAGAVHTLPGALRDPDGEGGRRLTTALTGLAARLHPEDLGARSLSATVVVAQLRSAVVDLLQVTGLTEPQARAVLPR
jgi:uncharacterized membrane protein YgaE (UPF0421/DUF939 family)